MKSIHTVILGCLLTATLAGCNTWSGVKQDAREVGQSAGHGIQKAGEATGKGIEKAGEKIQDISK